MSDLVEHLVSLRAGGKVLEGWNSYEIDIDMLQPADDFSVTLGPVEPVDESDFAEAWAAVAPDTEIEVYVDGIRVLSGFVDDRRASSDPDAGDTMTVNGRDRGGRLVDESCPLMSFRGLEIEALAQKTVTPWFESVSLSNVENRALILGVKKGARAGKVQHEGAAGVKHRKKKHPNIYRKVQAGETRWAVLEYYLRELELLGWAAADGKSFVIGEPNYDQEPTFSFFHPRAGSRRSQESNVNSFEVVDSVGERYSQIVAVGAHVGNAVNYGEKTVKRRGVATDGPGAFGIGKSFQHRKVLLLPDDGIRDDAQATIRAEREMAERDAAGHTVRLVVDGHGQLAARARRSTLFAFDTIAHVESEVFGIRGSYYITKVVFRGDADNGPTTEISLVPKGTVLKV